MSETMFAKGREWVSQDKVDHDAEWNARAMGGYLNRIEDRVEAAEQQRDRLLEAISEHSLTTRRYSVVLGLTAADTRLWKAAQAVIGEMAARPKGKRETQSSSSQEPT